ncbi:MAG TPA: wax ester/triacylglycerol synthase domain-containing protein [Thermomicrobiales bacterium]|nr:wax ester/triacylglycerol synthase domain-containing protein [Thermomicrobiales bacterium]
MVGVPIDRLSTNDLMSLASERGSTPMQVGAVLLLEVDRPFDPTSLVDVIQDRVPSIPRLRQRLLRLPPGLGRPVWVDDPDYRIANHVSVVSCPEPGGLQPVLDIAASMLTMRLRPDRPLWRAVLVTQADENQTALVVVFHHVLADGIAGLAVLGGLVDGTERPAPAPFPQPAPTRRALLANALLGRARSIRRLPRALRQLATAATELRPALGPRLPRTSINQPTGPNRRYVSLRFDLQKVIDAAHTNDATVNDLLLTAIAGALRTLLASRGEFLDRFVISVPFSDRRQTSTGALGNRSGVIPLVLPATGDATARLEATTRATRAAKLSAPAASNALLGPVFRLLARTGLYRRFINNQRLVHSFVTNLRGPVDTVSIAGFPVTGMLPLGVATGNVTVSFAALSYAGNLVVTIASDPQTCPDLSLLAAAVAREVHTLVEIRDTTSVPPKTSPTPGV